MKLSPAMRNALEVLATDDAVAVYPTFDPSYMDNPEAAWRGKMRAVSFEALADRGLATAERRPLPGRVEVLFSITDAGRAALEAES